MNKKREEAIVPVFICKTCILLLKKLCGFLKIMLVLSLMLFLDNHRNDSMIDLLRLRVIFHYM